MEQYREKLILQNRIITISAFILAMFSFLAAAGEFGLIPFFNPLAGDSHWHSMWRGFICGAAFGILLLMIFGLVRNILALRNEKKLKKLYIKDHDERSIQIWTSARAASMQVFLLVGLAAGIVAGYFSITVSVTILACVTFHALLGMGFKIYYSNKF